MPARSRCFRGDAGPRPVALFAEDGEAPELACEVVRIQVGDLSLHRLSMPIENSPEVPK